MFGISYRVILFSFTLEIICSEVKTTEITDACDNTVSVPRELFDVLTNLSQKEVRDQLQENPASEQRIAAIETKLKVYEEERAQLYKYAEVITSALKRLMKLEEETYDMKDTLQKVIYDCSKSANDSQNRSTFNDDDDQVEVRDVIAQNITPNIEKCEQLINTKIGAIEREILHVMRYVNFTDRSNFRLRRKLAALTDKLRTPTTLTPVAHIPDFVSTNSDQKGSDFWLCFPRNIGTGSSLRLLIYITSNNDNEISVQVHNITGFTTYIFTKSLTIRIDNSMQLLPNLIEAKGIRIMSHDTIYVTGYSDYSADWSDAFNLLPTGDLGTAYIVASYHTRSSYSFSFVSVLAVHSDTTITITLNTTDTYTYNGQSYKSGDRFEIYLKQYHSFLFSHIKDLTGTRIESNKPIAVQSGDENVYNTGFADTLYLVSLPPISSLGSEFIVPSFMSANKTSVRVIPLDSSTSLMIHRFNGTSKHHLTKTLEVDLLESRPTVLKCSKPCLLAAYSYFKTPRCQFMTLVPALSQYSYNYTYLTPHFHRPFNHYLSIIVKSSDVGGLLINNKTIFAFALTSDTVMVEHTSWTIITLKLDRGTYSVLSTIRGSFYGALAYGIRSGSSYAYPLGMKLN